MRSSWKRSVFVTLLLVLPWTAARAGSAIEIGGRLTFQGSPLAGAQVFLRPLAGSGGGVPDGTGETPSGLLHETLTDARGRFRLVAPGGGMWTVRIEAGGRAAVDVPLVPLLESAELPTIELAVAGEPSGPPAGRAAVDSVSSPAVTVSGQVVEQGTGRPIPRALIWPASKPGDAVRADGRGAFEISVRDRGCMLRAAAGGFRPSASVAGCSEAGQPGAPRIELHPAAAVSGRVVDADGRPLDAVDVRASEAYTRSSEDGRFTISGLPAGVALRLSLTKRGFSAASFDAAPLAPFEHRGGARATLTRGRTGIGSVVDEQDRPVAAAEVRLRRDRAAVEVPEAATDAEGRFELPGLAAGRYRLEVGARGFAPAAIPGVEIPAGETAFDLGTVVLRPGSGISGRVFETRGEPVAGVEIYVSQAGALAPAENRVPSGSPRATSDAAGAFAITDLRPGEPVGLSFRKAGYLPESLAAVQVPGREPLDVLLLRAARITGVVLGEDGAPVAGARVEAAGAADRLRRASRVAVTGSEGRFDLEGVPLGRFAVTVDAEDYLPYRNAGLQATEGQVVDGLEVILERGATLAGKVTGAAGRALAGASLDAYPAGDRASFARRGGVSGGDGHYRLAGLGVGRLRVVAEHRDFARTVREIVIEPGLNTLDIELESGSEVSGRVVDETGVPAGGALVTLDDPASRIHGRPPGAESAADGTFLLRGVPDGSYRLLADKDGYARARGERVFTVGGEAVSGLVLELERGATISGRVLGLEFDDLAQLRIAAHGTRGRGARAGRVDYQGRYSIAGLTPGRWTVFAELRASGRRAEAAAVVEAGVPEVGLDLEFSDGHTLTGWALQGGAPLEGASIHLTHAAARSGRAVTDPGGAFTITGLASGTYQLKLFQLATGLQHRQDVEIYADRDVVIEVAGGWIAGRLRDGRDGRPIAAGHLTLEPASGSPAAAKYRGSRAVSDSRGDFRLDGVPPGSWSLTAAKGGYASAEVTVEVAGGTGVDGLDVEMEPAGDLTFEAVLESGRIPAAVRLAVFDATGRAATEGLFETTASGRVRLDRLAAGRWQLVLTAENSAQTHLQVTVPGDLGRLRLPAAGRLEVLVPELVREEAAAQILLIGPGGHPFRTWGSGRVQDRHLMVDGRFAAGRLRPGTWRVTATAADGRSWSASAQVVAETTAAVTLR